MPAAAILLAQPLAASLVGRLLYLLSEKFPAVDIREISTAPSSFDLPGFNRGVGYRLGVVKWPQNLLILPNVWTVALRR